MAEDLERAEEVTTTPEVPVDAEAAPPSGHAADASSGDNAEASSGDAAEPGEVPEAVEPAEAEAAVEPEAVKPAEAAAAAAPEAVAPAESAAPAAEAPAEPAVPEGLPKQWYIIHTYSGFENKVAESLRSRAQAFGFADKIGNVLIPTEEVVEMRNGKKVISKRLLYPGYVLVEMAMDDQLWHEVKNTPRVTGFVGGGNNPVPLTADEVNSILYRQATSAERPRPKQTFEKNETVRIVDGPFASFSGKVDEINSERDTLRVMVTIFGRSTPVELEFTQVEKIS